LLLFDLEYEGGDLQDDKCYINNEINYMISTFVYYEAVRAAEGNYLYHPCYVVLTPQIAGHNLINKLGLIKFGNYD